MRTQHKKKQVKYVRSEDRVMKAKKKCYTTSPANKVLAVLLTFVLVFSQSTLGYAVAPDDGANNADTPATVSNDEATDTGTQALTAASAVKKGSNSVEHAGSTDASNSEGQKSQADNKQSGETDKSGAKTEQKNYSSTEPKADTNTKQDQTDQSAQSKTESNETTLSVTAEHAYLDINGQTTASDKLTIPNGKDFTFTVVPEEGYAVVPESIQVINKSTNPETEIELTEKSDDTFTIEGKYITGDELTLSVIGFEPFGVSTLGADSTDVSLNVPASALGSDRIFVIVKTGDQWTGTELKANGESSKVTGTLNTTAAPNQIILAKVKPGKVDELNTKLSAGNVDQYNSDNRQNYFTELESGSILGGKYLIGSLDPASVYCNKTIEISTTQLGLDSSTTRDAIYRSLGITT